MLRAVDGRRCGAAHREIAIALFGAARVTSEPWKTSSLRDATLRLVRDGSEAPLGFGRALLRNVVFGLSAAIVVGYFTPLFDGSGRFQGWHDRAAGAIMRDARTASGPSAAPAGACCG